MVDASTCWPVWTNQAGCRYKAIFQILVIVSVFMLELVDKLGGNNFGTIRNTFFLLGFLRHLEETIALLEDKTTGVDAWAKKLFAVKKPPRRIRSVCGLLT